MMSQNHILRRLEPGDIPKVKELCKDCFPIQYSDHWFTYITSQKVFSLGCFLPGDCPDDEVQLISMVIAEEQKLRHVEREVGMLLASAPTSATVIYIISLGVLSQHRKQGHGSLLVNSLLHHVCGLPTCLAVYLHVQATNSSAQRFYNRLGFKEFITVPNYYYIQNKYEDAFLYCCYTNGGVAFPHTFKGYALRYAEEIQHLAGQCCQGTTNIIKSFFYNQDRMKS